MPLPLSNYSWYPRASTTISASYNNFSWSSYSANRISVNQIPLQNVHRKNVEFQDTERCPADRGDAVLCINCGKSWGEHWGWGCMAGFTSPHKSEIEPEHRYLTIDMQRAEKKKFSRISQKRLKKKAREQLLARESLLK